MVEKLQEKNLKISKIGPSAPCYLLILDVIIILKVMELVFSD